MNSIKTSTLRPGLLVSLKTSTRGNISYSKSVIESEHQTEDGKKRAKWETERTISDPAEFEAATHVRTRARNMIVAVCKNTAFGLLCPEADADKLDKVIAQARAEAEAFNAKATMTRIGVYVIAGRIAADNLEAVRAINSEVRDLLSDMETSIKNLDVDGVRKAAAKAREVGAMMTPDAAARIQIAIDASRAVANKMAAAIRAGEQAAIEIDQSAIRRITDQRTAFLDLDEAKQVEAPSISGRALDLSPSAPVAAPKVKAPSLEV